MKPINYILLAAISLDGKIAKNKSHATTWTSPEDKVHMRKILSKCDVVIVGNNTYKTSYKPLSKRNCIVLSRKIKDIKIQKNNCVYINPQKANVKKYLNNKKYKTVCILGGAQVYDWALENKMIDQMYLTIEPIIFGQGISLFNASLKKAVKFKLSKVTRLNKNGSLLLIFTFNI